MSLNHSGEYKIRSVPRTRQERMAIYDSLPPHVRKLLQEAPYALSVANPRALMKSDKTNRATITRIARESARATYGDKYPIDLIQV